jgi:ubiquinone/menaquinone biosynthesis C-methylase UbiE
MYWIWEILSMPKFIERNMSAMATGTSGRTLDYAAPVYDCLAPLMVFGFEQRCATEVIAAMELKPQHRVLDVGCGTGSLTRKIGAVLDGAAGACVTGIDAAERMLDVAHRKTTEHMPVQYEAALAESLPFADHAFERAVSTFFFHHIDYGLKVQALSEIWRTLVPDGRLIIVDVDTPTTVLGRMSAWAGYWLFKQEEIRENIEGKLRDAFDESPFHAWRALSHHSGYMTLFELVK